jgi:septal ring factor EnvC (AmiA/AmiB activator)
MVLAEDPKMYEDALRIWSNWSVLAPMTLSVKELRMLEPLFTRILPSELAEMKQREEAYQQEIRRYKQLLAAQKKERNSLKKKLISKENDIKSLKYKIESLEKIDQEKNRKKRTTSKR